MTFPGHMRILNNYEAHIIRLGFRDVQMWHGCHNYQISHPRNWMIFQMMPPEIYHRRGDIRGGLKPIIRKRPKLDCKISVDDASHRVGHVYAKCRIR